jgi:polo-like kinase 1
MTNDDISKIDNNVFVRKWMKTKQAIIFRLSNKTIQVGFKDHSEVILYNDTVNYRNKKGEVSIFKIEDALNSSNFEMNKRIKYTQNILTKMININNMKKDNSELK